MRKTKIICTMGPATDNQEVLETIIELGMDVARFNFSHGTHEEQLERLNLVRSTARRMKKRVAMMLDTKGPEIRLGLFKDGAAMVVTGTTFILTTREILGTAESATVGYQGLPRAVKVDSIIYLDDGNITLKVVDIQKEDVICTVLDGGKISDRKKVNLPDVVVDLPAVTPKDVEDVKFAVKHHFDFIAASFVRSADHVLEIRKILEEYGSEIKIIAKIENREGLDNLKSIVQVADGIMVARGDLGVEIPAEEVPLRQKEMIRLCKDAGKPVIIATQMLDSMMRNPRPTRAEASDVANAIFEGVDAIMLSGETAAGHYPIEAVKMMNLIASRIEAAIDYRLFTTEKQAEAHYSVTDAIGRAVCQMADTLGIKAIITPTQSGYTARMIAKYRPAVDIIAVTPKAEVVNRLKLVWGITPIQGGQAHNTDEVLEDAVITALGQGLIQEGDLVIITAGVPVAMPGSTNLIKVHTVGKVITRGLGIGKRSVTSKAYVVQNAEDLANMPTGHILICDQSDASFVSTMIRSSGIVAEHGGLTSHAAIVGLNLGKPVLVGAKDITKLIKTGDEITIDCEHGLIYLGRATIL